MMTVSTRRVCTPPRYTTISVLLCVHAVSIFLKMWWSCASTSPKPGVDLPIKCCWVCTFPQFAILQWCIGLDGNPRCGAPFHLLACFVLALAVLLVSAVHVWSRSLSFWWVVLWSAAKGSSGAKPECVLPLEYLSHNLDDHCLAHLEDTGG